MKTSSLRSSGSRHLISLSILFSIIIIIYSNTFYCSWHFDDYHNILLNPKVKLTNLSYESITDTFYATHNAGQYLGKKLYRPLSFLTLGLNWYYGKDDVFGYHIVNITFHILTAFFLYFTILQLFNTPNLKNKYNDNRQFIALLSAVLWAINPIQVQAVTYIVQRMAAMAAMFYIISIFFYVKARLENYNAKAMLFFLIAFISFLCGLGSKENAALLPAALILVEFIFFQDMHNPKTKKMFAAIILAALICIIISGVLLFFTDNNLESILKGYDKRPFTLSERLLTEPRIVLYYISQIFYPIPSRFSVEHQFTLSTSLFHPWTTIPSIIFITLLICFSILSIRKYPVLSFAILFYFLNHSIESTFISLELCFEHRNYLPSFFLFLPVAIGFKQVIDYYEYRKRAMYVIIISSMVILVSGIGVGTYVRNMAWATEKTLWEDALQKAPDSNRVYHNLGWGYYERIKNYDKAMELYRKALDLRKHNEWGKPWALNNIANLYYIKGDYENASKAWAEALSISDDSDMLRYRLALSQARNNETEIALNTLSPLFSKNSFPFESHNLKGLILLKNGRLLDALQCFKTCLKLKPNDININTSLGICFYRLGNYSKAKLYLNNALVYNGDKLIPLLWLIETHLKTNNEKEADKNINALFSLYTINELSLSLENLSEDSIFAPSPGINTIIAISDKFILKSDKIRKMSH
jgi:protein O-mannosyl-transferase